MKRLTITALFVGAVVCFAGAADTAELRFKANLTGDAERPSVLTDTTGKFTISFNQQETKAKFSLRVEKGVAITDAYLYCNHSDPDDPIVAFLFGFIPGGVDVNGGLAEFALTDENIAALHPVCGITDLSDLRRAMERGLIYVNVHSVANFTGEVRGQVTYDNKDTDGDGIKDSKDPDIDGDGLANVDDPTPYGALFVDPRAPAWPQISGDPLIEEWYTDLPWHQKLGTFAGNTIDQVFVLPHSALKKVQKNLCMTLGLKDSECMLKVGVNNVLGVRRTDTLFDTSDPRIKAAEECQDSKSPCIEVKLQLSSFWTQTEDGSLAPRVFGTEPQQSPPGHPGLNGYYGGYTVTDGTTYAPQMPWYMSHYCEADFSSTDQNNAVCYGDYFSTFNAGFNPLGGRPIDWPKTLAWSVFPAAAPPGPTNHCKPGETQCTLAMAGFDLSPVKEDEYSMQYIHNNQDLLDWFNTALMHFPNDSGKDKVHFPWSGEPVGWKDFIYPRARANPFLGEFEFVFDGKEPDGADRFRADHFVYPRKCDRSDLSDAATLGDNLSAVDELRRCGLNYELHHNGYYVQWPSSQWDQVTGMLTQNQYGRTSFLFAGLSGLYLPVSFYKEPDANLSIYERVYNASIFSLYMPITNVADNTNAFGGRQSENDNPTAGRNYTDIDFYHTLLMVNHMETDPWTFTEGIRGKVLWHNEYRSKLMYELGKDTFAKPYTFNAAFKESSAESPYHNNTCDGCHVRNGSGVPINTDLKLDKALQAKGMTDAEYSPYKEIDYTFTGKIKPMKLVFFDLNSDTQIDSSRYSEPLAFDSEVTEDAKIDQSLDDLYYNNKIMNFYGDSFHVTTPGYDYQWSYKPIDAHRLVVPIPRVNSETGEMYQPVQVAVENFTTSNSCELVPNPGTSKPWPESCAEIDEGAIRSAIDGGQIGIMLLNGKRLSNLSVIEAIPNKVILSFHVDQQESLGENKGGEIIWNAGARDGIKSEYRPCETISEEHCYIGRFGWIGDRASLEDQVANAAFVEMNILTTEGYDELYDDNQVRFPIRYAYPNCGPANSKCVNSGGNSELSEEEVTQMAEYARWLGNPTRSEFQVSQQDVIDGEAIFRQTQCHTCHVIDKIQIDPEDTMLSKAFRDRLTKRGAGAPQFPPFLSYIGTDLLMHDMGYLSQVGEPSASIINQGGIRDKDGVVKPEFKNYIQKIRTPALKGLRFNRFVTDSHNNTKKREDSCVEPGTRHQPCPRLPACDFLLHDGRACDAIEAAFLHDGPAIKALGMIEVLNGLKDDQLRKLRAFLYSL